MEDVTKLIQAVAVAAWPVLVFYVIWTYRKQVAAVIDSAKGRKFMIKVGGQEISMDEASQQQQKFISDLQHELIELRKKVEGFQVSPAAALSAPPPNLPAANAVLWVDDHPKKNSYFIELLQERGYRVDTAVSTAEGLRKVAEKPYRVILSDMARTEGGSFKGDAGVSLLKALKEQGVQTPFVVFCTGRGVSRYRDQVKELGGQAITSSSTELRAVLDELAPPVNT